MCLSILNSCEMLMACICVSLFVFRLSPFCLFANQTFLVQGQRWNLSEKRGVEGYHCTIRIMSNFNRKITPVGCLKTDLNLKKWFFQHENRSNSDKTVFFSLQCNSNTSNPYRLELDPKLELIDTYFNSVMENRWHHN